MVSWLLKTPYGDVECHKSQSFGQPVWKKPTGDTQFGVAYFSDKGHPLERDVYVHVKDQWIPGKGNEKYARRMSYKKWEELGKPKKIDGKKIGIVVKTVATNKKVAMKLGDEPTLVWKTTKKKIDNVQLHRFVSKAMRYIVPEPNSVDAYRRVVAGMKRDNVILMANDIQLKRATSKLYDYVILVIGNHLVYVEILPEDLQKPFPPDAMIPSDAPEDIGEVDEEDIEGII